MKAEIYQYVVPVVSLVGILISVRQYNKGNNSLFESLLWCMLWLFISFVAIFPDATAIFLSKTIGIKDHINAVIFIGLAISFFLNFRLFILVKKQNKLITDLVRKIAINDHSESDNEK